MPPETKTNELCREAQDFLKLKAPSTAEVYQNGLRRFVRFFREQYGEDKTLADFLDMLYENAKLPRGERKRLAESILVDFIDSLKREGLSNNTIRSYIVSVQNFLKYYEFPISARWLGNYPKSVTQKSNRKHKWKLEQIKEFVDKAPTYRDKAIILFLFQSGIGISDLCLLDYGDVRYQLEEDKLPIMLNLSRLKTGVPFRTFIGADAVKYLRLYLQTRSDLDDSKPLFTMWNSNTKRLSVGAIQKKFKEIAKELDFLRDNGDGMNPARPHSLRSAFRSRLTGKMDGDLIEFFMGHEIGEQKRAYINLPDDELRELYAQFEHELSIETTSKQEYQEKESKIAVLDEVTKNRVDSMETSINTLGNLLNKQVSENNLLQRKIDALTRQMETMQEFISLVRDDPELLQPYTSEQMKWLTSKSQDSRVLVEKVSM